MKEAAARKIMIKGGKFMELFAKTDTIVFDKTGTVSYTHLDVYKRQGNGFRNG